MKKRLFLIFMLTLVIFLTGCGKENKEKLRQNFINDTSSLKGYYMEGVLSITNNDDTYNYDVKVGFKKDDNFKVTLLNKANNYEQIILRNTDGVYIVNPSLNRSFKFQSEWPYNNSQSYLLHNLLNDIRNDSDMIFEKTDDSYIFIVKTNYSNNKDLVKEKIYVDKDKNIKVVEVIDSDDNVKMKMTINNIDYNSDYNVDYFNLDNNMTVFSEEVDFKKQIDSILYPMYIPQNTYLSGQDKVSLENGERIIMTFAGDYPFMLIQETLSTSDDSLLSVSGDPLQLIDTVGVLDDSSITWVNDGISYYLVSNTLDQEQLVDIANSMSVASIVK